MNRTTQSSATPDAEEVAELAESLGLLEPRAAELARSADLRAWLIEAIAPVIDRWLRHDRARLGQVLYRIDVDERDVEKVVRTSPIGEVAEHVAALLVDRVIARVRNRRRLEQQLRES